MFGILNNNSELVRFKYTSLFIYSKHSINQKFWLQEYMQTSLSGSFLWLNNWCDYLLENYDYTKLCDIIMESVKNLAIGKIWGKDNRNVMIMYNEWNTI